LIKGKIVAEDPGKNLKTIKPEYKVWFETKDGYVFGKGVMSLLDKIEELGTLSGAAKSLNMSYRHAWGIIKRIEKRIGEPLLHTYKGGKLGGGGTKLTSTGKNLKKDFKKINKVFNKTYEDKLSWEGLDMKISARNRIKGFVVSLEKGEIAAKIKIKTNSPCIITSLITSEAVDDLKIKEGDNVVAVVKATEVMISKD
jgi:molybdate transport system regulatory protein